MSLVCIMFVFDQTLVEHLYFDKDLEKCLKLFAIIIPQVLGNGAVRTKPNLLFQSTTTPRDTVSLSALVLRCSCLCVRCIVLYTNLSIDAATNNNVWIGRVELETEDVIWSFKHCLQSKQTNKQTILYSTIEDKRQLIKDN